MKTLKPKKLVKEENDITINIKNKLQSPIEVLTESVISSGTDVDLELGTLFDT